MEYDQTLWPDFMTMIKILHALLNHVSVDKF